MLGTSGGLRYLGQVSALLQPTNVNLASPFSSSCLSGQVYTTVESWVYILQVYGFWRQGSTTLSQWLDDLNCVPDKFTC